MSNPTIKDPEFITPDMDQKMMVRALARIEESKAKDKNKNEYQKTKKQSEFYFFIISQIIFLQPSV